MNNVATWTHNGFRYWQILTADAELVASIHVSDKGSASRVPPQSAKVECYSRKKGLASFLGYLEGEQHTRALEAFSKAFWI